MKTYRVGTFTHERGGKKPLIMAYLRDFNPNWEGCIVYYVAAKSGADAKKSAHSLRRRFEEEQRKEEVATPNRAQGGKL